MKKDQLLAVLENRDLVATVAANKGQVDQAQANLQNTEMASIPESIVKAQTDVESDQEQFDAAKKVLDSRQQLFKEGALARKLVDDARCAVRAGQGATATPPRSTCGRCRSAGKQAQIDRPQAQVISAQGQLQSAEAQVAYSEVRSPSAGIVADRPLYAGDMAAAGTPLLVVMDISRVVARVNVPAAERRGSRWDSPPRSVRRDRRSRCRAR